MHLVRSLSFHLYIYADLSCRMSFLSDLKNVNRFVPNELFIYTNQFQFQVSKKFIINATEVSI